MYLLTPRRPFLAVFDEKETNTIIAVRNRGRGRRVTPGMFRLEGKSSV